jgi:pimeloyl-ACP methyl ester carboxylesterase
MESLFETYKSSRIHYYKSSRNNNKAVLICFHGYAESAGAFSFLEKYIENDFTLIAIDLPFHGQTEWNDGPTFTSDDLHKIIQSVIIHLSLTNPEIYLLGFSMGGRIALGLLSFMPSQIKRILLLAPDGLRMSKWYWLATQTAPGNKLFSFAMKKPELFLGILHVANKARLLNQSIYKFIDHYINNKQVRIDLYNRWTVLRKFKPDLKKIKSLVIKNKIAVKLIYGQYDRIIFSKGGQKFRRGIEPYCDLYVIPAGHQMLNEKNIDPITRLLKN